MHLEPPKSPFHSIREFCGEYLMIVVSILTALGLEHVITNHHHAKAAEQARQQIVQELRTNLEEVRAAWRQNEERMKPLAVLASDLTKELQSGASKATINQRLLPKVRGHFSMGFVLPTMRHEAWDVVVANQSASYIDAGALRRYTAAYAAQRESISLANHSGTFLLNGPRLIDVVTDLELLKGDPMDFLRMLNQLKFSMTSTQINLQEAQAQLEASLKDEPTPPAQGH